MSNHRMSKVLISNLVILTMLFSLLGGLFPMAAYADDTCNLTFTITPDSVTLPASVTLSGRATRISGAGISSINVRLWCDPHSFEDPSAVIGDVYTDSDGYYSYVWTLPSDMQNGIHDVVSDINTDGGTWAYVETHADLTVSAPTRTITASAGDYGTISPSGEVSVGNGEDQAFTITPDADYIVDDVLVDGASVGAVTTYTFNSVTADHTIAAGFAANLEPPDAPTSPVTDDDNNTFGWTNVPGFDSVSDYEYTKNGGTTWNTCEANPQTGFDGDIAADQVKVRIKADPSSGRPAGAEVQATAAFTANPGEPDTTPPTVADKTITSPGITQTGVTLSWNKATDDVSAQGALQYLVYRSDANNIDTVENIEANGTALGSYETDINTKEITGLTGSTTYYFNVIVKDEAGNKTAYTMKAVTTEASSLPVMAGTVIISGNAKYGETLTADISGITYTPDTAADVPTYQWKRGGVDISGATASTYTVVEADIGQTITVTVTADGVHATGSITSAATATVDNQMVSCPVNIAAAPSPAFAAYYPRTANVTGTGFDLLLKINMAGTAYYGIYDVGASAPEAEDLRNSGIHVQMAATSAETMIIGLNYPEGVAVDRDGNIYVADTNNNRVRKYDPQGHYLREWTGFNQPRGVAVDNDGNIYVADTMNHLIKKYGADGVFIRQWGGEGTDNGKFKRTRGVAVDNTGYVYVADEQNQRIQKFTTEGEFITKWGKADCTSGSGDGQFNNPTGVAVDGRNGTVYVADYNNHRIQKFKADGEFVTKWGSYGQANGQFYNPAGIVVDSDGNVYVAEYRNHRVQKFSENGTFLVKWGKVDCTAGSGEEEFNGSNGLAMDGAGNIYVTDRTNSRIQKLAYKGSASITGLTSGCSYDIYIVAENASGRLQADPVKLAVTTDAAPAFAAGYPVTANATLAAFDLLFKMNEAGKAYYKVYEAGADEPESMWLKDNGESVEVVQTSAESFIIALNNPAGVAVDGAGNIYVADMNSKRVRKYDPAGNQLFEWTSFNDPQGVAVDNAGNLYVADNGSNPVIKKYGAEGGVIREWGGQGTGDGQFDEIRGVAADSAGYVYAVQWNNSRVQKFASDGEFITKWGSYGDGNGQFKNPTGVAVDKDGNVYVADYWNHRIQKFTSLGQYLAKWGSSGTGNGQFYKPSGVAVDKDGQIYVADYANNRVQKLDKNGAFLAKWGKADCSPGSGEEEFNGSYAVAAVDSANVYVADRANNRIQKLAYKGGDNITGLAAGRSYDIFVAAEDERGNLQAEPVKLTETLESLEVATPVANPPAGMVLTETPVTLSCATAGATIHYTTDGSEPTSGSPVYIDPITVNISMTIKAVAVKAGMEDSAVLTAVYTAVTGDEVYVSTSGGDGNDGYSWDTAKRTIKDGINTVIPGGTVYLANGIYEGENNRNITISKNVVIQGQSKDGTVIDGGNAAQVFTIGNGRNVIIRSVTVKNGTARYGAIANSGSLTIADCLLKDNTATEEGGAVRNAGTLTVSGSSFLNNAAPVTTSGSGGAIYSTGALTVNDSIFADNTAKYGGAIHSRYPSSISNSTFHSNSAWYSDGRGGAIYNISELELRACTFESNRAYHGSAVYNAYGEVLTVTGSTFQDNSTFYNNGAIYNDGTATVHFCRLIGNTYGSTPQDIYRGTYGGQVDAEYNWWCSNDNPSARVGGDITISKWLVLTVTAVPSAIFTGGTATVTADLRHDQDGGYHDPADGHVPDGIPVAFGTSLGSLAPTAGTLTDGQAVSAFMASAAGLADITATVDNQTVATQIAVRPEYCPLTYTALTHGSIFGPSPQTIAYGGDGTEVTAVPDPGYHFVNWSDGVDTASRRDTNVTRDISVTANFEQNIALVITADSITKTYGETDPALTYEITDGVLAEGDEITGALERDSGNNAETYAIRQGTLTVSPRSDRYNITFVPGTLTINKAPLTVTADNKEKTYDGAVYSPFTIACNGFVYGEDTSVLGGSLVFNGSATTAINAETYKNKIIPGGFTSSNYDITFEPGTLVISKRALDIAVEAKSKVYGNPDPELTCRITSGSLVEGDAFTGKLSRVVGEDVGMYEIQQGTLTPGDNYAISYTPADLTIIGKALTVKADNKSKIYDGGVYSDFTVTCTGFIEGESESDLDGTLEFRGEATTAVNAGVYEIIPYGLSSDNYDITFVPGILTTNKAPLTVTADDKFKVCDGQVFTDFTVIYVGFAYGDDASCLRGELEFTGDSTTAVYAGVYKIIPGGLDSDNYDITFVLGQLEIVPPSAPAAPTRPVVDDASNTFGWTNVIGFASVSDYEYSVNGGTTWNTCTANPQPVGNNAYVAGAVQVRVKADSTTGRPAGDVLVSDKPYTVTYYSDDSDSTLTDNTSIIIIASASIDKQTTTTPNGQTVETFTVQAGASAQIEAAKGAGKTSVQFNVESSQTSVTNVNIPNTVLQSASDLNVSISTPNATLELPAALVNAMAQAGQGLSLTVTRGGEVTNPVDTTLLGAPTTINTDIVGTTQVTIPLAGIAIPTDPQEREAFLSGLAVFTLHSDGDEQLINGEIIYDTNGNPVGITFPVDKFSTFAIVKLSKKTVTLSIDRDAAAINGIPYTLDASPFVDTKANRTLAPLRFIGEALGAKVEWLPATRQVRIKDGTKEIILTLDTTDVLINGVKTQTDCAPVIAPPGRTFLPLRFISETLGAEVAYDSATRQISIIRDYNIK